MAMDQGMLKSFLNERVGEVKHATSIISDAILDKDGKEDTNSSSSNSKASQQLPAGAASAAPTGGVAQNPPPPPPPPGTSAGTEARATPSVNSGTDPEGEKSASGPSRFLSQRTRQAMDDVLRDPDVERLTGRAKGFARERLLQAEAAARVLKEEEEKEEGSVKEKTAASGDKRPGESDSETPIISGLVSEASEFVAGRVGEAKAGVKEVVQAAVDGRRSRQTTAAAAAAAERSEKDEAEGGGGDAVRGGGKGGKGGTKDGAR